MRRLAMLLGLLTTMAFPAAADGVVFSSGPLRPADVSADDVEVLVHNPTAVTRSVTVRAGGALGVFTPHQKQLTVEPNGISVAAFACTGAICGLSAEVVDPSGTVVPLAEYTPAGATAVTVVPAGGFTVRRESDAVDLRVATQLGLAPIQSTLGTLPSAIAQTGSGVAALDPRITSLQTALTRQTRLLTRQARTLKRLSRQVRRLSKTRR
jgi:hypothetical protein